MLLSLVLYVIAFVFIWFGSGLIVSSTSRFAKKLRLSSFAFSFIFLGLLTSVPEFSVGLQAVAENDPEIFVGNLIGGIPILFLVVIPILAIFGKGISLRHELAHNSLLLVLGVIIAPSIMMLDKKVSSLEGLLLVVFYLIMIFNIERKNGILDNGNSKLFSVKSYSYTDILKILIGIGAVFISSSIIVDKTIYFADFFNISAFYVGLIAVSLGTNVPEMSIAIRSVIDKKKEIAMGDYLGSAAANTLLFGIFTILGRGEVLTEGNFIVTFLFIAGALGLFYFISRTRGFITRANGFFMIFIYLVFVIIELIN